MDLETYFIYPVLIKFIRMYVVTILLKVTVCAFYAHAHKDSDLTNSSLSSFVKVHKLMRN